MHKNVLFRGCTRPAMFLGVPYIPFFIGAGSSLLLTFYLNMWWILLMPVVILIMRQMARRDELIFRLLGLNLQFRVRARNVREHSGMWVFTPNGYRRTQPGANRNLKNGPFIISGRLTGPASPSAPK